MDPVLKARGKLGVAIRDGRTEDAAKAREELKRAKLLRAMEESGLTAEELRSVFDTHNDV